MNSYISILLLTVFPVLIAFAAYAGVKMLQMIRTLEYETRLQQQQINELEHGFAALCKASSGEGSHIAKLEQRVRGLSERQDTLDLRTQKDLPYSKASQLASDGASVEELISACGLTRAEAELVIMLHGSYGQG